MTADAPDLVTLLYRADWTRLSLAADVSITSDLDLAELRAETGSGRPAPPTGDAWQVATDLQGTEVIRSMLLVAPGGRYRHQGDGFLRGCDGDRRWQVSDDAPDTPVAELPAATWPLERLLRPSWLLTGFTLDIGEPVTACGREALRVVATPRHGIRAAPQAQPRPRPVDRLEVIVDAELGILLRHEEIIDGQPLSVTELTSLRLNPAGTDDDAQFQPPSGWDSAAEGTEPPAPGSPGSGWGPAKVAADLAAKRLGAWMKSSEADPFEQATREDPEAAMPQDEPMAPDGPDASPVSDEILHLLYTSEGRWAPGIAATLHWWHDPSVTFQGMSGQFRRAGPGGFEGLARFIEVMGQQVSDLQEHTRSDVRIGGPDRYRVDIVSRTRKAGPIITTVCDGEQCWHIDSDGEISVGPATPLAGWTADLFDGSWLLTDRLTGGTETTVGGRRGYRVAVAPFSPRPRQLWAPDEVVVDAESGFLLRSISRVGSGSDSRVESWHELRDVTSYVGAADDFRPDIPAGTRVTTRAPTTVPVGTSPVGFLAREAVKGARSRVEGFLGSFRGGEGN